jgi:hypothetical protein
MIVGCKEHKNMYDFRIVKLFLSNKFWLHAHFEKLMVQVEHSQIQNEN